MATSRNYQDVASSIRPVVVRCESDPDKHVLFPAIEQIAQNVARTFATRNERFNYSVFYAACGLDKSGYRKRNDQK